MKKFIVLITLVLFFGCNDPKDSGAPPAIPPVVKHSSDPTLSFGVSDNNGLTYKLRVNSDGSTAIGDPNSTETTETPIWEKKIESDTGTESVGNSLTQSIIDETDGTEDTVMYRYRMEAGAMCVCAFYGPPMSAAPSWTPCNGCRVLSDGGGSDPWDVAGGVYYTGAAWAAD
jgi:hypothetical protein